MTIDEFIRTAERDRPKKCLCCRDPKLRDAIEDFQIARDAGKTTLSWGYFFQHFVTKNFGQPKSVCSLRTHVRVCMAPKKEKKR